MEQFDLIIVGSGSGNAIPEYLSGKKIALIERSTFGGTCLNVGCIPSKMFVLPGDVANTVRNSAELGVNAELKSVDWAAIKDRVWNLIDPISDSGKQYRATGTENLELIEGTAKFIGDKVVEVNGRQLTAPNILLATGSRPVIPDIEGIDTVEVHTSDTVMRLEEFPKRMAVLGGGFIAAELGHVFSSYGSEVTLFNRSETLLKGEDEDVSKRFAEIFSKRVNLKVGEVPTRIEKTDQGIFLHSASGVTVVDAVLVATGRTPNSDTLELSNGGIAVNETGIIIVDKYMRTNIAGVWAIGDVANNYQLKHVANAEAKIAFWNIANSDDLCRMDYTAVPHAVFTDPQIASVGLTEQAAKEQNKKYVVGTKDYSGTAYGWALMDQSSFAKVLIDSDTRQILGAHIIGPQAATLIQPLIQAMKFGHTADQVANEVFYIHPALTEVIENALLTGIDQLD